jgi:hypothetical protein
MENLDSARFILRKGDWLAKLDLKDAYLPEPEIFALCMEGAYFSIFLFYVWFSSSSAVFYKNSKSSGHVLVHVLRRQGMRLIVYLDDILTINI